LSNHVLEKVLVADFLFLDFFGRKSKESDDELEEFLGGATLHEEFFVEELGDYASHGPHIYGGGVVGFIVKV
jgi:hypothetical protein